MPIEYHKASLLLFTNARGVGTLLTAKCPTPELILHQMPGVCPGGGGGLLAAGIDSHISFLTLTSKGGVKCPLPPHRFFGPKI